MPADEPPPEPPPPPPPPPPPLPSERRDAAAWFQPVDDDPATIVSHPVQWGIAHAIAGIVVAYGVVLMATTAVVGLFAEPGQEQEYLQQASIGRLVLLQSLLWVGYVGVALGVSRFMGLGPRRDYGWRFSPRDWYQGALVGIGLQLVAVPVIYLMIFQIIERRDVSEAARRLTSIADSPFDALVLILIVAIGAPVVEELFFRGLLLRSLQRRFGPTVALVGSALIFAAVHFQALQFPALFLFGLVAAWLTLRTGRLGPAIWAHVGFNGVTVFTLLVVG